LGTEVWKLGTGVWGFSLLFKTSAIIEFNAMLFPIKREACCLSLSCAEPLYFVQDRPAEISKAAL